MMVILKKVYFLVLLVELLGTFVLNLVYFSVKNS